MAASFVVARCVQRGVSDKWRPQWIGQAGCRSAIATIRERVALPPDHSEQLHHHDRHRLLVLLPHVPE
jgi:hypothetical protein